MTLDEKRSARAVKANIERHREALAETTKAHRELLERHDRLVRLVLDLLEEVLTP